MLALSCVVNLWLNEAEKPDFEDCWCAGMTSEIHDVIPATNILKSRRGHNKL